MSYFTGRQTHFTGRQTPIRVIVFLLMSLWLISEAHQANAGHEQDSLRVEALTEVLRTQFRAGQLDSASATIDQIKEVASAAGMALKLADCQANYGLIEQARGDGLAAIHFYEEAARRYDELGEHASTARMHTAIGQLYISRQDYPSAYQMFRISFDHREAIKDSLGMLNNLINMGGAIYFTGDLKGASAHYYRALRMSHALEQPSLTAQVKMNIGNIHMRQRAYERAIDYKEKALDLYRMIGDESAASDALLNLGISWYAMDSLERAEALYRESLDIKQRLQSDAGGIIKLNNNLGLIAKERGDFPRAIRYYEAALDMTVVAGDLQTRASILNNLASIYMETGDPLAQVLFSEALQISDSLRLRKTALSIFGNLHAFHAQRGEYREAYNYLLKNSFLRDSLYTVEGAARIAELQTMYHTEIKEKENHLLREQTRVMRLRFSVLSVSAVALSFIALAFIVLFNLKKKSLKQSKALLEKQEELIRVEQLRYQREQQHLKEMLAAGEEINRLQLHQIQEKNRELATSTLLMINKNEVLSKVRNKAVQAIKDDSSGHEEKMQGLIREINGSINLDEQWALFKRHFESVHSNFFSRLRKDCPGLTSNELKLCAYLRMNLSTKEIAQMLNITIDSAITKRYRLRKKLGLQGEEGLVDFIMKY